MARPRPTHATFSAYSREHSLCGLYLHTNYPDHDAASITCKHCQRILAMQAEWLLQQGHSFCNHHSIKIVGPKALRNRWSRHGVCRVCGSRVSWRHGQWQLNSPPLKWEVTIPF